MVTIAHSVDGCYTPLAWKYLGAELDCRLRGCADAVGYDRMREASLCAARGDLATARRLFTQAIESLPDSAAPHYHLALLSARAGRDLEAQSHCRRALELDSSYQTPFNNLGFHYLWQGRCPQAEAEFHRALALNPVDAYAMAGLARVAICRKHWAGASEWSTRSLSIRPDNLDAHRCLAQACARTGRLDDAIEHYEQSLSLALHGHKPFSWHILTCTQPKRVVDEDHWLTYADLGRLLARRRDGVRAISCYQIAFRAGFDSTRDRLRLARLYLRAGNRGLAFGQLVQAARQLPASLRAHGARVWGLTRSRVLNFIEDRGLA
jgi:Flp pilus assembly protein TadD